MKRQIFDWRYMGNMLSIPIVQSSSGHILETETSLSWHWHHFILSVWSLHWCRKKDSVNVRYWDRGRQQKWIDWFSCLHQVWLHHFSPRGKQQVGKQWTAILLLRKWWQDLVKMTQLMITFVEHFSNSLAHCMVVDMWKVSMLFHSTSSLQKQNRKNKYVDLSVLPPCLATLKLHILCAKRVACLMKRSSVAQVEEAPLSNCSSDHEVYPNAVEELLFNSHNADESDKEGIDKYFGDDCMRDEHDWNLSDICDLEFTWNIFICVWHLRNIINITNDLGQSTSLNFQKFKITKFYSKITVLLENTKMYFRHHQSWLNLPSLLFLNLTFFYSLKGKNP